MARTFQQKAQLRKLTYAALILALFTGSYLYRKHIIEQQAYALQLRESARGEVNLASSAVRLLLTGSRGFAATVLWNQALDLRERHKWNELELVVSSITQLQPYFVSPWVFQSWNMAFNVSVECDKPRDKYYYITRGMELLAEGERRHRGVEEVVGGTKRIEFPGNPEMRFYLGFFYLRKIGFSDENNTMRCLLEMSCIDPAERDPGRLWIPTERGRAVNMERFERLCRSHPRLVRRLREQLGYDRPEQVVTFLEDNSTIPSRYEPMAVSIAGEDRPTPRKHRHQQWPVLPPPRPSDQFWPNADNPELSQTESVDTFVVARSWFDYAQEPLPLPNGTPHLDDSIDRVKYRVPKIMVTTIFRSYPARSQAYVAENLETEGWFDEDGWLITDWLKDETRVGTERKYHAAPAWTESLRRYLEFGNKNGFNDTYKIGKSDVYRQQVNYDVYVAQSEAERTAEAIYARKLMYQAERKRLEGATPEAFALLERAMPFWLDVLLSYPDFRNDSTTIEQTYEFQRKFNSLFRDEQAGLIRKLSIGLNQMAIWPHPPLDELLLASEKNRRIAMACLRTPFEVTYLYDLPPRQEEAIKRGVLAWTQAAKGPLAMLPMPGQQSRMLAAFSLLPPQATGWKPLISQSTIEIVLGRYGITRKQ